MWGGGTLGEGYVVVTRSVVYNFAVFLFYTLTTFFGGYLFIFRALKGLSLVWTSIRMHSMQQDVDSARIRIAAALYLSSV